MVVRSLFCSLPFSQLVCSQLDQTFLPTLLKQDIHNKQARPEGIAFWLDKLYSLALGVFSWVTTVAMHGAIPGATSSVANS